jgi:hypothetical protein
MPRLSDAQRALRAVVRRASPLGRDASLRELDGYWLARRLYELEPAPVVVRFRGGATGRDVLDAVAGVPRAGECMRRAGVTESSSADEVIAITFRRFAVAITWLRRHGVEVSAYRRGCEVTFVCGPPQLVAGVPLEEAA